MPVNKKSSPHGIFERKSSLCGLGVHKDSVFPCILQKHHRDFQWGLYYDID